MVWSTAQSALYKAVDNLDSCNFGEKNSLKKCCEKTPEKCTEIPHKNTPDFTEKTANNFCKNSCKNIHENYPKNSCYFEENSDKKHRKNCGNFGDYFGEKCSNGSAEFAEKRQKNCNFNEKNYCNKLQNGNFSGLSALFSDSDFVLLAGLIFILMNENADKKLIFALVFVMLG